jgi:hypothetical protein
MLVAVTPGALLVLALEPQPATTSATSTAQAVPAARAVYLVALMILLLLVHLLAVKFAAVSPSFTIPPRHAIAHI